MGGFILRSKPEEQIFWKQKINERIKSGMSVSEWCKVNEISKHKYHYWNNKINKSKKLDTNVDCQVKLACLVVFELKIGSFKPEYIGKMNFYLEALDRELLKEKLHELTKAVGIQQLSDDVDN
jgi:hypothetical protein